MLQIIEGLGALGHDIHFASFSSRQPEDAPELLKSATAKNPVVDQEKFDTLMGSFVLSGVSLTDRNDKALIATEPKNGNDTVSPSYFFLILLVVYVFKLHVPTTFHGITLLSPNINRKIINYNH